MCCTATYCISNFSINNITNQWSKCKLTCTFHTLCSFCFTSSFIITLQISPEVSDVSFSCYKYEPIVHTFLCDNESFECDQDKGFDTYLSHLGKLRVKAVFNVSFVFQRWLFDEGFDEEIRFSDSTTLPLSGKVYIGFKDQDQEVIHSTGKHFGHAETSQTRLIWLLFSLQVVLW